MHPLLPNPESHAAIGHVTGLRHETEYTAPRLGIVVPCYNEEEAIPYTINTLCTLLERLQDEQRISSDSFILFVDDGSKDRTFRLLQQHKRDCYRVLKLSNNRGHQFALLAGLQYMTDKVDCSISIDADLQDDLNVIPKMLDLHREGYHIVCGVRSNRSTDGPFKRMTAWMFYKIMDKMGVTLIENHADFRLLSAKALQEIARYKESNLFLRGIFTVINLRLGTISYTQGPRRQGKTKYHLGKMLSLAARGVTAFSSVPIRMITFLGIAVFLFSILLSINVLVVYMRGEVVPGWASITLPMYFFGGLQLLCLGVIGEYVANTYTEAKRRPHYHIEEVLE
ncbi:glycosyltransferase family 2 protein [Chitinophaga deserti]|uniref:glycosyltransferase family 2 protein n=1 Tax=Chitinophaga deserti TaxID=2164099 RepID=UPI000D6D28D4|nr:glycosyltransferase family 2 protein [Chitinophaga deserti]